jgi:hypothetical protein
MVHLPTVYEAFGSTLPRFFLTVHNHMMIREKKEQKM